MLSCLYNNNKNPLESQSFHMYSPFPWINKYCLYLLGSWQHPSRVSPAGWLWSISLFKFPLPVLSIIAPALTQLARGHTQREREYIKQWEKILCEFLDQTHKEMGGCGVGLTMFFASLFGVGTDNTAVTTTKWWWGQHMKAVEQK